VGQPFIGEIRMFGGNFAPQGWAFCDGSVLPISEYEALFALIGTTYGGNGTSTFALPDLRGRIPVHQGGTFVIGQIGGEENHTLLASEMPVHTHTVAGSTTATSSSPTGTLYANAPALPMYSTSAPTANMNAAMIGTGGNSLPHSNMMPYLAVGFIIALVGIFPSRN